MSVLCATACLWSGASDAVAAMGLLEVAPLTPVGPSEPSPIGTAGAITLPDVSPIIFGAPQAAATFVQPRLLAAVPAVTARPVVSRGATASSIPGWTLASEQLSEDASRLSGEEARARADALFLGLSSARTAPAQETPSTGPSREPQGFRLRAPKESDESSKVQIPAPKKGVLRRVRGWKAWVLGGALAVVAAVGAWRFMAPRLHTVPVQTPGVIEERYPFHMRKDADARVLRSSRADGALALSLLGHQETVASVSVSADGKEAVTVSKDGAWKVWNLETGEVLSPADYPGKARGALFAEGGKKLILLDQDSTVRIVDRRTGVVKVIGQNIGQLIFHAFSPDAQRLAVASKDGLVQTLDLGAASATAYRQDGRVLALGSTTKGTLLLTSRKGILKLWSIPPGGDPVPLAEKPTLGASIIATAINEDGTKILAVAEMGGDQGVMAWTVGAAHPKIVSSAAVGGDRTDIVAVASDRRGARGALLASDGRLWLFDPVSGKATIIGKSGPGARVYFSADGTEIYTTESGGPVRVWKAR